LYVEEPDFSHIRVIFHFLSSSLWAILYPFHIGFMSFYIFSYHLGQIYVHSIF
jgi:hypothetical protein